MVRKSRKSSRGLRRNKKRGGKRRTTSRRVRVGKRRVVKKRVGKRNNTTFVNALKKLVNLHPSQRVQAMKVANDSFIRQFCQKVNLLRSKRLTPTAQKRVRAHSKSLRSLVAKNVSIGTKRKNLTQRGGFLFTLVAPLLGILGKMAVRHILRKAVSRSQ